MIEYLRLAFGTACVLLPGLAVARALRTRSVAAMFAWSLACVFVAWAVVFTVHRSIHLAVAVLAAITLVALVAGRRERIGLGGARAPVWIFGVVLGWFLWHVESPVVGDGLFHEARVRKLVDLTSLHLRTVDEFKDGGLHPGLCVPALARLPRARLLVLGPRSRAGRAPRAVAARAARVRARVRGGCGGARLAPARGRRARGAAGARLLRAGARRLVRGAVAAGDRVAAADGPRGDHALLRRANLARLCGGRGDLRRPDADPSDLRRLPARAPPRRDVLDLARLARRARPDRARPAVAAGRSSTRR